MPPQITRQQLASNTDSRKDAQRLESKTLAYDQARGVVDRTVSKYADLNLPKRKVTSGPTVHYKKIATPAYFERSKCVHANVLKGCPTTLVWRTKGLDATATNSRLCSTQFPLNHSAYENVLPSTEGVTLKFETPKVQVKLPDYNDATAGSVPSNWDNIFDHPMSEREIKQMKHQTLIGMAHVPTMLNDMSQMLQGLIGGEVLEPQQRSTSRRGSRTASRASSEAASDDESDDDDDDDPPARVLQIQSAIAELDKASFGLSMSESERKNRLVAIKKEFKLEPKQMSRPSVRKSLKDQLDAESYSEDEASDIEDEHKQSTKPKPARPKRKPGPMSPAQKLMSIFKKE